MAKEGTTALEDALKATEMNGSTTTEMARLPISKDAVAPMTNTYQSVTSNSTRGRQRRMAPTVRSTGIESTQPSKLAPNGTRVMLQVVKTGEAPPMTAITS